MNIARTRQTLWRGLRLKCPACGQGSLYRAIFRMEHHCRVCGLVFEREQGYFTGAIYINVIATESLLIAAVLIYFTTSVKFDQKLFTTLFVLGAILPVLFFHHSRSLWLAVDHIIDPWKPGSDLESDEREQWR